MFVFTKDSNDGFQKWPLTEKETVGYVVKNGNNQYQCYIVEQVYFSSMPHYRQYNIEPDLVTIGTFHSHPSGCFGDACYYQPPSTRDLKTFYKFATESNHLKINFVVTAKKLFIIDMTMTTGTEQEKIIFNKMIQEFKNLKKKRYMMSAQELVWIAISNKYPSIMTVLLQDYIV